MHPKSDIIGKTYSLYAGKINTDEFYSELSELVDSFLLNNKSIEEMISIIRKYSGRKRLLKAEKKKGDSNSVIARILNETEIKLLKYFTDIDSRLNNLTIMEKCESTLTNSREQHLLSMLEIEIVNRFSRERFLSSEAKFAFLPPCLHDLDKECLSASDGTDYVCMSCSKNCSINSVSRLMKLRGIKAYIWREADLKKIFKIEGSIGHSVGVIGVACIPELVNGLRLCAKYDVHAIGVPLDANRVLDGWEIFIQIQSMKERFYRY